MRIRWAIVVPAALLLAGALLLAQALLFPARAPQPVQSIVGKPAPRLSLPPLDARGGVGAAELASGRPAVVNLWASWCPPCRAEMPLLLALERRGALLLGVNVRDAPADAAAFLRAHGDPFARVGVDRGGHALRAFGATGLPETYVVDGRGVVRWRHGGLLTERELPALLAALEAAGEEAARRGAGGAPLPVPGVPATAARHIASVDGAAAEPRLLLERFSVRPAEPVGGASSWRRTVVAPA